MAQLEGYEGRNGVANVAPHQSLLSLESWDGGREVDKLDLAVIPTKDEHLGETSNPRK